MKLPIKYRIYNNSLWVMSGDESWVRTKPTKAKILTPITQGFGVDFIYNQDTNPQWKGRWFYKDIIGNLQGHNGIDFIAPSWTCLYAPEDGEIIRTSVTYGKAIYLKSDKYEHVFGHLQDILVTLGQKVKKGQLIGHCDNTGLYTTGSHLHWGVRPIQADLQNGFNGYIDQRDMIENLEVYSFPDVYTEIDEYRLQSGVEFNKDEEWIKIQKKFNTTITRHDFHNYLTIKSQTE